VDDGKDKSERRENQRKIKNDEENKGIPYSIVGKFLNKFQVEALAVSGNRCRRGIGTAPILIKNIP
jgi:hypothetical protein